MNRRLSLSCFAFLVVLGAGPPVLAQSGGHTTALAVDTTKFADEIAEFRKSDSLHFPRPGGVVFVGSSSIRMWPHLAADFPGVNVVQRGFGGSELSDAVYRARQIVVPYRPRMVVLYAGDNDLAAGRTPQDVLERFKAFVSAVHTALPRTRIVFVSIKPSWARVALLARMKEANRLVEDYIGGKPALTYVDVFSPMLDRVGKPRMDLLAADSLHMNARGYSLWRRKLSPIVAPLRRR